LTTVKGIPLIDGNPVLMALLLQLILMRTGRKVSRKYFLWRLLFLISGTTEDEGKSVTFIVNGE